MLVTKFAARVSTDVPGAPTALVRMAVIDAAAEFCEITRAWREIQDAVLIVNDVNDFEVDLPSGARPLNIEAVWCNNRALLPATIKDLQRVMPDWQTAVGPEPIYYNSEFDWESFRIYPKPANVTGTTLRIQASFQPTEASTSLPDFMFNRYREVIAAGAKARLMEKPDTTWGNPKLAAWHREAFVLGMNNARINVLHGGVSGGIRVPPRRFI